MSDLETAGLMVLFIAAIWGIVWWFSSHHE